MNETQHTITEWARATFGEATNALLIAARANQEMAELMLKLSQRAASPLVHVLGAGADDVMDELADVFIVLYQVASFFGYDAGLEVTRKMAINRNRIWKVNGNGVGQHVDQSENAPDWFAEELTDVVNESEMLRAQLQQALADRDALRETLDSMTVKK